MSLAIDPPAVSVPATGGKSNHKVVNSCDVRVIFKVKCSNNNDYRVNPVYSFVDAAGQGQLEITRTNGPPKEDRLVIQWGPAPDGATDPQAAFPSIPSDKIQSVTVPLSATAEPPAAPPAPAEVAPPPPAPAEGAPPAPPPEGAPVPPPADPAAAPPPM